jgi:hypothetical protein
LVQAAVAWCRGRIRTAGLPERRAGGPGVDGVTIRGLGGDAVREVAAPLLFDEPRVDHAAVHRTLDQQGLTVGVPGVGANPALPRAALTFASSGKAVSSIEPAAVALTTSG